MWQLGTYSGFELRHYTSTLYPHSLLSHGIGKSADVSIFCHTTIQKILYISRFTASTIASTVKACFIFIARYTKAQVSHPCLIVYFSSPFLSLCQLEPSPTKALSSTCPFNCHKLYTTSLMRRMIPEDLILRRKVSIFDLVGLISRKVELYCVFWHFYCSSFNFLDEQNRNISDISRHVSVSLRRIISNFNR